MGKAGRAACIFTPFVLTIASFICIILIEVSGWTPSTLPSLYFLKVDFANIDTGAIGGGEGLGVILKAVEATLADNYELHLWNYCTAKADGDVTYCSSRHAQYTFNPVEVWGFDTGALPQSLQSSVPAIEDLLLGDGAQAALNTYKKASHAMFILWAIAFFTTIATILFGILALFSRWGSLFTWIFSVISAILNLGAAGLATGTFVVLVDALQSSLDKYDVVVSIGKPVLAVAWLAVIFSWAATLFWLFSICCCSGRSNPHHRGNRGGLLRSEPKGEYYEKGSPRYSSPDRTSYDQYRNST